MHKEAGEARTPATRWSVTLRHNGHDYRYPVSATTRADAIDKARKQARDDTGQLGWPLVAIDSGEEVC